jgi:hypothetical protein
MDFASEGHLTYQQNVNRGPMKQKEGEQDDDIEPERTDGAERRPVSPEEDKPEERYKREDDGIWAQPIW